MKVKILDNVSSYRYNGVSYKPGETLIIQATKFVEAFMEDLTPKVVAPEPEPEAIVHVVEDEPEVEEVLEDEPEAPVEADETS